MVLYNKITIFQVKLNKILSKIYLKYKLNKTNIKKLFFKNYLPTKLRCVFQ